MSFSPQGVLATSLGFVLLGGVEVHTLNVSGIAVNMAGGAWYSWIKVQQKAAAAAAGGRRETCCRCWNADIRFLLSWGFASETVRPNTLLPGLEAHSLPYIGSPLCALSWKTVLDSRRPAAAAAAAERGLHGSQQS